MAELGSIADGSVLRWVGAAVVVSAVVALAASSRAVPALPAVAAVLLAGVALALVAGRRPESVPVEMGAEGHEGDRDPATGVLSRAGLVAELDGRTSGEGRNGLAFLILRVDRLDVLNERLGRASGDEILRSLAARLEVAGGSDATVARLSSASFVVLRETLDGAERWARAIAPRAAQLALEGGPEVHLSFAAALVTTDGFHQDAEVLMAEAEAVARRSFDRGSSDLQVRHLGLDPMPSGHPDLAARVEQAVRADEIRAYYQPIVDLRSMEVVGVEALARWPEAPAGLEGPEAFLEVVGVLGLRSEVFDQILRQVCADFTSDAIRARGWWVSVNIGAEECSDQTLPGRIAATLADTGLAPDRLVLEVSERVIPDPAVERALRIIGELDVRLAIDDFGSGWSSFAQIRSLPIELVKLDRALISSQTVRDLQVTSAIIELARALGLRTLAEGIETGEELLNLCIADCDYGQGYWWGKATTLADLLESFPPADDEAGAYGTVFPLRPEVADDDGGSPPEGLGRTGAALAAVLPLVGARGELAPEPRFEGHGSSPVSVPRRGPRVTWRGRHDDALLDRLRAACGQGAHLGLVRGTEP